MNAAAKVLSSRLGYFGWTFTSHSLLTIGLLCAIFGSSVGIIYTKNSERHLCAEMQNLQNEQNQLEVEWGQLMLERGALTTPSRLQTIATAQLHLKTPSTQDIVMIEP